MEYLKERKNWFIGGLSAFCIALMIASATVEFGTGFLRRSTSFVLTPVMSVFSNTGGWIAGRVGSLMNIGSLEAENERLRRENEELTLQNSLLETKVGYLGEAERLLNVSDSIFRDFPMVTAYITTRGLGIWYSTPIIRLERGHGVLVNMPVVTNAVFGRIVAVGGNYAEVVTIIQEPTSIAVFGERTGDEGFARGDYGLMLQGLMRLDFTNQNAEFGVGDIIKTSAMSSLFPPGLIIGEIIEIRLTPGGERYAVIRPHADIANARMVLIIMDLFEHIRD